jgi:hypothetical protein
MKLLIMQFSSFSYHFINCHYIVYILREKFVSHSYTVVVGYRRFGNMERNYLSGDRSIGIVRLRTKKPRSLFVCLFIIEVTYTYTAWFV